MKKILILFLMLSISVVFTFSQTEEVYSKQEIIETTLSKSEMWINLKKWVSEIYRNSKYVIDIEDKESGLMVIKWTTFCNETSYGVVNGGHSFAIENSIKIEIKDNKYRYTLPKGYVNISSGYMSYETIKNLSITTIQIIECELKAVVYVSEVYFNSSLDWEIGEQLDRASKDLNTKSDALPDVDKKGKRNFEKTCAISASNIIGGIISTNIRNVSHITSSLKKSIIIKDDF